jgi:hypothetical protein
VLESGDRVDGDVGPRGPVVTAFGASPVGVGRARPLWAGGFYIAAIWQALIRLDAEVQNKIGRRDVSQADAFVQALLLEAPNRARRPRLRLGPDDCGKR